MNGMERIIALLPQDDKYFPLNVTNKCIKYFATEFSEYTEKSKKH